ncbi:MAG: XRE family transcriptional regulator [Candidatus Eisenbacteria bacterium]|nr:XRE family transcriptional regulator [Candidatus Eisenbacteria bacterium]
MKIRSVRPNNRKRSFEVETARERYAFPYVRSEPSPTAQDAVVSVEIDPELGREAFSYALASGRSGLVHIEQVLEYNQDPVYMRNLLLYRLTVEVQQRIDQSPLAKREIIRRLGTSPAQLYRLLDQTNYRKSVDQMLRLLQVLDCEVELVVRPRSA